jgi:Bacterial Ig-like domain (group 1)
MSNLTILSAEAPMTHYSRLEKDTICRSISRPMFALLVLGSVAACDKVPTEQPVASHIAIFGGDDQVANAGSSLANPLSVRVTDGGGRGLPNVKVDWQITSGEGEFLSASDGRPLIQSFSVTNTDGVARVLVQFTVPGTSTVAASVAGLQGPPLTFTATVFKPADVVIRFGPFFDCTPLSDTSVFVSNDVTVPVGAKVEWQYAEWLFQSCEARITSISVPHGGEPFDSGIIKPGLPFQFVPRMAGTWEYVDAINGGSGKLTARAP